jgi:adenylate cyclase
VRLESAMRITCSYLGKELVKENSEADFMFGRAEEKFPIGLDLTPDLKVSRIHGRIWFEDGAWWIEDRNSSRGTRLNDVEIKGRGKHQLRLHDIIEVGDTKLEIGSLEAVPAGGQTSFLEVGTALITNEGTGAEVAIAQVVDATDFGVAPLVAEGETARRLKIICDLPIQFCTNTDLQTLLPAIVDRLAELIRKDASWAVVLRDPDTDVLLLKAHNVIREPNLSETLARRAMTDHKAFIWKKNIEPDVSMSIVQNQIDVGMYAPLLWQDKALGVICGGALKAETSFTEEDLLLLVVVAQYAAMAVANHQLQTRLKQESSAKANLLRQFSPKVAEQLLTHRGRLRLGGERSEVTVLNADIRGFTNLAREMDADDVVQMLNDYFAVVVPVLFAHNGTIDKYIGDAILAVFGSPESDANHYQNGVMAAIEMQAAVTKLNEVRRQQNEPCREFGIGLHCGEVVHGFVGTMDRMEFTVIGDAVNRTARYCAAAAGGEILISPEVYERVWKLADTERISIKTKHEGDFFAYRVKSVRHGVPVTRT